MSKNNECVIYDENAYYGKDYEEDNEMRDEDYSESLDALKHFFAGEKSMVSDYINPLGMNEIIARGTVQRWDGQRSGCKPYKDLDDLLYGTDSVFRDCVIDKIWDEDGHLFISGYHHDGSVEVEVKQLTDAGMDVLNDWEYASINEDFHAAGKTYHVGFFQKLLFMRDFWDNPDFCEMPHYAEKVFGYKQHEQNEPSHDDRPSVLKPLREKQDSIARQGKDSPAMDAQKKDDPEL